MNTLALLEVRDRDGHVRHYLPITAWPAQAGRALDNDLVIADPHVAAHHFKVDADDAGVYVQVGDTVNGVRADGRHLAAGERIVVGDTPLRLDAGDTHLTLRLARHAVAPEQPLATPRSVWHATWPTLVAGVVVLVLLLFGTWLDTDPDDWNRALGSMLVAALTAGLTWCAGWSLLSKIFTRRSHFWWHVRVLLLGVLAMDVAGAMSRLLAFSFSWPSLSDFAFVPLYAIAATMLYFHVKGVEPRRPQRMRAVAVGMFLAGTALTLWFNRQNRDQFGDELYMSHLFPPALRVSRPIETDRFAKDLSSLQTVLDDKAKKRDTGGGDDAGSDEE